MTENSNAQLVTVHNPIDLALPTGGELIPFPTGRYAIPDEDMAEFGLLKTKEQERIKFLLTLFAKMEAGGVVATSETLGFQLRALRGYGASNLRALFYKWQDNGWKSLARKFTNGSAPLPAEFVEFFRALCEKNGRSLRQAMKAMERAWFAGDSIPGFGTWREYFSTIYPERDLPSVCPGTPSGWGKSNLYTLQPTRATRALKTKGFAAAKAHLPSLIRDTGKLLPLQLVVIDDFEIDQLCYHPETRSICRMSGIVAMDVATRRIIGMILKPRTVDDDGKKQSITRAEVRLLLYGVLRDYGIPAHGMTILAENAAAAVTTELELTFKNLFGGRVAVSRTGVIDQAVLKHGFRDTGGKPWLKGWIESFFNLMHNVAAGVLPGQKGANYLAKPANLDTMVRATQRLIGTGPRDANLSAEQLARASIPFQSPGELCDAYLQIFRWMEERTDHEMRGFDRVMEFRTHEIELWRPFHELGALTQEEQLKAMIRDRAQSVRERWADLWPRVTCTAVPERVLMMMLLTPKKAPLKGHHLTFTHNGAGFTWVIRRDSEIAKLAAGTEVLCYFDPTRPDHAHVCRLDGRPLGEVVRFGGKNGTIDITDASAVTDAERQIADLYNSVLATVRERPLHQLEDAKAAEAAANNAALVAEADALRNKAGITATLNRPIAPGDATTAAGEQLAAQVITTELDRAVQKKQARIAEAAAAKHERDAAARRAALTTADEDDFLGGDNATGPALPAPQSATPNTGESLDDYLA